MANVIKLVQGDSRPDLVVTIKDKGATPVSLLGASVSLKFRATEALEVSSVIPGSVVDHLNGIVLFPWSAVPGSLNVEPGGYEGEIEITFADSRVQTLYDCLRFVVREDF